MHCNLVETLESYVDLFSGDGHHAGQSHLPQLSLTRSELWARISGELVLGLLPLLREVAAKNCDKNIDVPK